MTPAQRREITRYLEAFDFSGLFTDATIGWDWPDGGAAYLNVPTKESILKLEVVADKRGVKVLHIPPNSAGKIPNSTERRILEKAIRLVAAEHLLIFTDAEKTQQIWQWTQHTPGKPVSFREVVWQKGKANELLIQKLSSIAFTLEEEDALDITGVVQRLTDQLNRDTVTKRFYDNFKKQKDAFAKFIEGLGDTDILAHYTSLMLNRIMFCYFLQRKGFLDGDTDYLRNRLASIQDELGEDQFHSFYRTFLRRLFHEGLGGHPDSRDTAFAKLIGEVPYLNGGIFDEHPIERAHPDLNIPDTAFEKVFAFFDQYDWHLDERPISDGNEINPEILGYVFEKYTNQKEMGAYYTKEDITEYISKNCILPFLFNAVGKKLPASVWDLLKADPDRYIYEAVRRGAGESVEAWEASLPDNIRCGLYPETLKKVVELDKPVQTLGLRKDWNTPSAASHRLPTEIWRETIVRHQRCHELRAKLRAGEVKSIDDFITLNFDIRQFAQDAVESADASLLLAFFKELKKVSVLDPTCGSGAFLFAALEILQPLYLACLERMRVVLSDWQSAGEQHPNWEKEIQAILDQAAAHPNEAYYINKTIIVHNLYGVDIMEEAIEICKLRLFLKLAAQLEPGQAVEPLPDIDFNVRAGNTLVGYASKEEIQRAFTQHQGGGGASQGLLQGIEHSLDDFRRILEQAEDADRAFQRFHALQEDTATKPADFRSAKRGLNRILEVLREQLDRFLAGDYDLKNLKSDKKFEDWQKSHQPFHWFIEFYGIMNNGGFDVVLGNPPWNEYSKVKKHYTVRNYVTTTSGNLYALCTERSISITSLSSIIGFIVQLPLVCSSRMSVTRDSLITASNRLWLATFDDRPGKLFDGLEHCRSAVFISSRGNRLSGICCSPYQKWGTRTRPHLLDKLEFSESSNKANDKSNVFIKTANKVHASIIAKLQSQKMECVDIESVSKTEDFVFYQESAQYWIKSVKGLPYYSKNGSIGAPAHGRYFYTENGQAAYRINAITNSCLFYLHFIATTDCFHLSSGALRGFPVNREITLSQSLASHGEKLRDRLLENATKKMIKTRAGDEIEYAEFQNSKSKDTINEIDTLLAGYYGFTEEELDFIINYDIKYRMGLGN